MKTPRLSINARRFYPAESVMTRPVVTVNVAAPINEVVDTMERHQIRRVPVVDDEGCCAGIVSQADIARNAREHDVADLVRAVSQETGKASF